MPYAFYPSPWGLLKIGTEEYAVFHISFAKGQDCPSQPTALSEAAYEQLQEYWRRERTDFHLPLAHQGTAFQKTVWEAIQQIPYGQTAAYRDLALAIGNPKALQAVGRAVGANPLAIVIPCHRVIKSDGSLGGYAFGTAVKKSLLQLETGVRACCQHGQKTKKVISQSF